MLYSCERVSFTPAASKGDYAGTRERCAYFFLTLSASALSLSYRFRGRSRRWLSFRSPACAHVLRPPYCAEVRCRRVSFLVVMYSWLPEHWTQYEMWKDRYRYWLNNEKISRCHFCFAGRKTEIESEKCLFYFILRLGFVHVQSCYWNFKFVHVVKYSYNNSQIFLDFYSWFITIYNLKIAKNIF